MKSQDHTPGVFILLKGKPFELVVKEEKTTCIGCDLSDLQKGMHGGCAEFSGSLIVSRDSNEGGCAAFKNAVGFPLHSVFKEVPVDGD